MKTFCIVIPIYKSEPDFIEEVSLRRLNTVIKNSNYNGVTIYPGHGDETNYDYEIENNPFLKGL